MCKGGCGCGWECVCGGGGGEGGCLSLVCTYSVSLSASIHLKQDGRIEWAGCLSVVLEPPPLLENKNTKTNHSTTQSNHPPHAPSSYSNQTTNHSTTQLINQPPHQLHRPGPGRAQQDAGRRRGRPKRGGRRHHGAQEYAALLQGDWLGGVGLAGFGAVDVIYSSFVSAFGCLAYTHSLSLSHTHTHIYLSPPIPSLTPPTPSPTRHTAHATYRAASTPTFPPCSTWPCAASPPTSRPRVSLVCWSSSRYIIIIYGCGGRGLFIFSYFEG